MPVLILCARSLERQGARDRCGRRRLCRQALHMEEVLARLRALLRRAAGHATSDLVVGPVRLDARAGRRHGQRRAGEAHQPRVPAAVLSDAPRRSHHLEPWPDAPRARKTFRRLRRADKKDKCHAVLDNLDFRRCPPLPREALAAPAHTKAAQTRPLMFELDDCLDHYIRQLDDRRSDANTIATVLLGACSFALWATLFGPNEQPTPEQNRRLSAAAAGDAIATISTARRAMCTRLQHAVQSDAHSDAAARDRSMAASGSDEVDRAETLAPR